jgi:hypothetical protein
MSSSRQFTDTQYNGTVKNKCLEPQNPLKITNLLTALAHFYPENAIDPTLYADAETEEDIDFEAILSAVDLQKIYVGTLDLVRKNKKVYQGIDAGTYGDIKMFHGWFLAYRAMLCPRAISKGEGLEEGWVELGEESQFADAVTGTGDMIFDMTGGYLNNTDFKALAKITDKHLAKKKAVADKAKAAVAAEEKLSREAAIAQMTADYEAYKAEREMRLNRTARRNPAFLTAMAATMLVYQIASELELGTKFKNWLYDGADTTNNLYGIRATELPFAFWDNGSDFQIDYWKDVWGFVKEVNRLQNEEGYSLSDAFDELQGVSEQMYRKDPMLTDYNQKYVKYGTNYRPGTSFEDALSLMRKSVPRGQGSHTPFTTEQGWHAPEHQNRNVADLRNAGLYYDIVPRQFGDFISQTISAINIAPVYDRSNADRLFPKETTPFDQYREHAVNRRGVEAFIDRKHFQSNDGTPAGELRNWWNPASHIDCPTASELDGSWSAVVDCSTQHRRSTDYDPSGEGFAHYGRLGNTNVFKGQVQALIAVYCCYPEARVTLIKNGTQFAFDLLLQCPDPETVDLLMLDPDVSEEVKEAIQEELALRSGEADYDNRKLLPTSLAFIGLGTLVGATFLRGYRNYKGRR